MLQAGYLVCQIDGSGYKVVNGIPDMLPEDAIPAEKLSALLVLAEESV